MTVVCLHRLLVHQFIMTDTNLLRKMDKQRIKLKLKNPNPLFEQWLTQIYTEAVAESNPAQIMYKKALISLRKYPLILKSGSECAILKGFGKNLCAMLDKKLAEHNNNKECLEVYPNSTIDKSPISAFNVYPVSPSNDRPISPLNESPVSVLNKSPISIRKEIEIAEVICSSSKISFEESSVDILPLYKSEEYAVLMTLLKHRNSDGLVSKSEIEKNIQQYCKEVCLNQNSNLNALIWKSINGLIKKDLIVWDLISDNFSLNHNGENLAKALSEKCSEPKLIEERINEYTASSESGVIEVVEDMEYNSTNATYRIPSKRKKVTISSLKKKIAATSEMKLIENEINEVVIIAENEIDFSKCATRYEKNQEFNQASSTNNLIQEVQNTVTFMPNSFEVILLVDKQENNGLLKKPNQVINQLDSYKMIKYEMRHLKVGDFAWVARHRSTGEELILPLIVERKRMDDLAKSIKDGRFHEQKFRLNSCGISNIIYLVEYYGDLRHTLPISTLMQATINTRIHNGFAPHFTSSLSDTVKFLAMMTKNLQEKYENKILKKSNKFVTELGDSNSTYLMGFQDFNASSAKSKTLSVSDMFIKQLLQLKGVSIEKALAIVSVYSTPTNLINAYKTEKNPELLLNKIKVEDKKGNINTAISKTIYQFFTKEKF